MFRRLGNTRRVTRLGWGLVTVVSLIPGELWGGLYKTQKQALAEAFPGGGIERKSAFLTDGQAKKIEELARARLDSKIIHYYVGLGEEGRPGGAAFFDTHVVRTTTETVMVLLKPDGTVRRVEILAFYEPEDYKVRQRWLDRMNDEDLSDDLMVGRDLVRVTGATLTVRALAEAVRRALALYSVLGGESES